MAMGERISLLDAADRVTGRTGYATNLHFADMLVAKVLRSPVPHARITRIDTQPAEAVPGVVTVVTSGDFIDKPRLNLFYGRAEDQPVVAYDRVRHVGEPIALVAAESHRAADEALASIELEFDELPAEFDVLAALEGEAPQIHDACPGNVLRHAKLRHGDLEAGFQAADVTVEETFTSPLASHAALETQVAIAQWRDGLLTVWTATQSPMTVRSELASIFGLDEAAVRIIVPPIGGGFGGKGNVRVQPLAAALAWKAGGRPVRLVLSRAEEFVTVTKHAAVINIKSGATRDGRLTARQISLYWNVGAYASSSVHLIPAGMLRAVGPYRIEAVRVDSIGVYTNLPPSGAFRGAMSSQTAWAHESHMDTLAQRLGMDPLEFRRMNLLRSGDAFATGEILEEAHYLECLDAAARGIGWDRPLLREPSPGRRRGRGLGVMMKHTIANSRSECRLALGRDGRVCLYTSTVEMGQGAHTALAQVCAQALDMPVGCIRVVGPDTAETPFDTQTASSRATFMMGNAVLDAAAKLKRALLQAAAELLDLPANRLSLSGGWVRPRGGGQAGLPLAEVLKQSGEDHLEASGAFATSEAALDPETGQGVASPHWHQGAGACEVEVDLETGDVEVLRYHSVAYAGRVVNPDLAKLQNDGNVVFGLGPTFMEEMVMDAGQVTNANLSDYLIPSILDIPAELGTTLLENEKGQIHGLGEMTLPPVAPAIANAIYDAVGARIRDLPLTTEKIFRSAHDQR